MHFPSPSNLFIIPILIISGFVQPKVFADPEIFFIAKSTMFFVFLKLFLMYLVRYDTNLKEQVIV